MLLSLVLLTLLPVVFGQQFLDGLIQTLNSSGLVSLASAGANLNSTPEGQRIVNSVSSGGNWTLFAPTNQACKSLDTCRNYCTPTPLFCSQLGSRQLECLE